MFTGIIEEEGIVTSLIRGSESAKLTVSAERMWAAAKIGESVAINGVCLTIVNLRRNFAEFDLSSESLKNTTLGELRIGDKVNLERALLLAGRLGGHLVTGHIDGVGEIKNKRISEEIFELYLSLPSDLLRYLVPRGCLAIEGVSLTIADLRDGVVKLVIIPHTAKTTTLSGKAIGEKVNVEVDILSKYIERHLHGGAPKGISEETLVKIGLLPMGWIDN